MPKNCKILDLNDKLSTFGHLRIEENRFIFYTYNFLWEETKENRLFLEIKPFLAESP